MRMHAGGPLVWPIFQVLLAARCVPRIILLVGQVHQYGPYPETPFGGEW